MEAQLANKTAVVTGGGSGIGYAIAERFIHAGAQVVIASRNQQRLDDAVARLGPSAQAIAVDVANDEQVKHLCTQLEQIDILVTCAGGALFGPVDAIPPQAVRDLFATRFFGQLNMVHYAASKMPEGSTIILCSGAADIIGMPMFSAGTAIDGAISAMARSLAVELAPRGIRVNALSPGLIKDTQIQSNMSQDQTSQFVEKTISAIPLKRPGIPAEVADAALFLAHCEYVTGQIIQIDGGWSAA